MLLAKKNAHNFDDKADFPHVRTLLLFDTREFLNVIALVYISLIIDYTGYYCILMVMISFLLAGI